MYDPNSLMYITREYENSLRDKIKEINEDDTVKSTLDSINNELDNILTQIDVKLNEIGNKETEINTYRADIHRFIDQTYINSSEFIDDEISSTESHPSLIANKQDKSYSKIYNTINFINHKIELDSFDSVNVERRFNKDTDKVHSFVIPLADKELLKVVEFAITYKQRPEFIEEIKDSKIVSKESSVTINRVFTGRFYIIRPDVENNPQKLIVKAIVENADNNTSTKDVKLINVRASKTKDSIDYDDGDGPEFDMYFQVDSNENLTINIADIMPYKFTLRKDFYESGEHTKPVYLSSMGAITDNRFKKIFYSTNQNIFFLVRDNECYYTNDDEFKSTSLKKLNNVTVDINDFWVKDIGMMIFIHSGSRTYICGNNLDNIVQSVYNDITDIKMLSTNEIVASVKNKGLYFYDIDRQDFSNSLFIGVNGNSEIINETVKNGIDFVEIDNDKLLVLSTSNGKMLYYIITLNKTTNKYRNYGIVSNRVSTDIPDYVIVNPYATEVKLLTNAIGVSVLINVKGDSQSSSSIFNLKNLKISGKVYTYDTTNLKVFNPENNTEDTTGSIKFKNIYETNLMSFAVTEDDKLYCFDDQYIIKAVNTVAVSGGKFDDSNSFLKLDEAERKGEYFANANPYLSKVLGVFENPTGIFIVSDKGLYQLNDKLILKTRYFEALDSEYFSDFCFRSDIGKTLFVSNNTSINNYTGIKQLPDVIKEDSNRKLRYKYYNLFTDKYQKYNKSITNYTYNKSEDYNNPLINFKADLYISLVDVTGSIYSDSSSIIRYMTTTYSNINPLKKHEKIFIVNGTSKKLDAESKEFVIKPNKYGFINYFGVNAVNVNEGSSKNNADEKIYKIRHTDKDTDISFEDVRGQILKLIYQTNSRVTTAVGKNELFYIYSDAKGLYEKYRLREILFNINKASSYMDFVKGQLWMSYIEIENENNKCGIVKLKKAPLGNTDIYSDTEYIFDIVIRASNNNVLLCFKDTNAGIFIWDINGIDYYENSKNYTWSNKLTSYTPSKDRINDGYIINVIDCKDSRGTVLVLTNTQTYFVIQTRPTLGSPFVKPFSNMNYVKKVTCPTGMFINNVYIFDNEIYMSSRKTSNVYKLTINDNAATTYTTVVQDSIFNTLVGKNTGINQINKIGDKLIIMDLSFNIISYDIKTSAISVIYKNTTEIDALKCKKCDVETDKSLYYTNSALGLWKLDKYTLKLECIDPDFHGNLFKYYDNGIYAIDDINMEDTEFVNKQYNNKCPVVTMFNPGDNTFEAVSESLLAYIGPIMNMPMANDSIGGYYKFICGNESGVYFSSGVTFDNWSMGQVIDRKHPYYMQYDISGSSFKSNDIGVAGLISINSDTYGFRGTDISINGSKFADFTQLVPDFVKTSDRSVVSSKKYYEIDNDLITETGKISAFDSGKKYFIRTGEPEYVEVDKSLLNSPEKNTEYYTKNLAGQYISSGYNLSQFSSNLIYYKQKYSFEMINTSGQTPNANTTYYTHANPLKQVESPDLGSAKIYYETKTENVNYNTFINCWNADDKYLVYSLSNASKDKFISIAIDLTTKEKKILPFRIDRLWNTSVGVFVRFIKNETTKEMNIGCLSDNLSKISYECFDQNITNQDGDLIEINKEANKEVSIESEKDIFISGRPGSTGNILKYSPKITDKFNKFHSITNSTFGFSRLFTINDDLYCIEKNTMCSIFKYNSETKTFTKHFTGYSFDFKDIAFKYNNGKKEAYIIGSGEPNIYKYASGTFKPVFEWFNKNIDVPSSVFSDDDFIYILNNDNNTKEQNLRIISNKSDKEFEYTTAFDGTLQSDFLPQSTYWTNEEGYKYILFNKRIVTFNMDKHIVGKPCFYGKISANTSFRPSGYAYENKTGEYLTDINGFHKLDHRININPILSYDKKELIYPCFDTDTRTLLPIGEIQHLYDIDGITVKHINPKFDFILDTEYGTFGIHGNEIYLRKRYTETNARWKLIKAAPAGNQFLAIKNFKALGLCYITDSGFNTYNSDTSSFDTDQFRNVRFANNGAKINHVQELNDGSIVFASMTRAADIKANSQKIAGLYIYRNDTKNLFEITYQNSATYRLTGIYETSKGLFITSNKIPAGNITAITRANYGNYATQVFKIDVINRTATAIPFQTTGNYWKNVVNGTLNPINLMEITEDKSGNIVLHRQIIPVDSTRADSANCTNIRVTSWLYDLNSNKFYPMSNCTYNEIVRDLNLEVDNFIVDNAQSNIKFQSEHYEVLENGEILAYKDENTVYLDDYTSIKNIKDPLYIKSVNNLFPVLNFFTPKTFTIDKPVLTKAEYVGIINNNHILYSENNNFNKHITKRIRTNGKDYFLVLNYVYISSVNEFGNLFINLYELDIVNRKFKLIDNSIIKLRLNGSIDGIMEHFSLQNTSKWDILEFNDNIFVTIDGAVFIKGNKVLNKVEDRSGFIRNNKVAYNLKMTIDNKELDNNLRFDTSNSDIDNFVIKEIGVIDINSYNKSGNNITLNVFKTNNNSVDQYFIPHENYDDDNFEYNNIATVRNMIKNTWNPEKIGSLINNRYIRKDTHVLSDMFSHHTDNILGDVEKYIRNLNNFTIELIIYPSAVADETKFNPSSLLSAI